MNTVRRQFIAALALLVFAYGMQAADILYVGHQAGVESDADDPDVGWRNPRPVKPLDIDGDNILGTDGWALGGKNQKVDKESPDYAWIAQTAGGAGFGGGRWDSPKDPSGKDTATERFVYTGNSGSGESFLIKIRGRELDNKILRLGVLYGSAAGNSTITLAQAEGDGRESVTSPPLEHDGTTLDAAFFNISGTRDGDVFRISTAGPRITQVAGLTFDTAVAAGLAAIQEPEGVVRERYITPLSVSRIFADHAIIQRDQPVPVWGWADLGTTVKVAFAGQSVSATPDASGRWTATLQAMKASTTPQAMTITDGKDTFAFADLLIGDLWLCSGQSNMEMTFEDRYHTYLPDSVKPADWPIIRQFKVGVKGCDFPQDRLDGGSWAVCNETDYQKFSAAGFFFAYTIAKETGIPVGIVNSTLGNTRIGSWVAPEGVDLVKDHVPADAFSGRSGLYCGQIAPLTGMALKGFLWYQGEGNNGEGESYFWKMKALIEGWRQVWGREGLPFYFAQLPSYNTKKWNWCNTREAQRRVLSLPHTGMAVLTDVGDNDQPWPVSLHPRNKYEVGRRLALWALARDYGKQDLVCSGPLFKTAAFNGGEAIIAFDHVGSGLMAARREALLSIDLPKPVDDVIGFEMAASDKKWVPAKAVIHDDTIVLSAEGVSQPVYARYLHVNNTDHGTLYNKEGLPASPFTTESWQEQ